MPNLFVNRFNGVRSTEQDTCVRTIRARNQTLSQEFHVRDRPMRGFHPPCRRRARHCAPPPPWQDEKVYTAYLVNYTLPLLLPPTAARALFPASPLPRSAPENHQTQWWQRQHLLLLPCLLLLPLLLLLLHLPGLLHRRCRHLYH